MKLQPKTEDQKAADKAWRIAGSNLFYGNGTESMYGDVAGQLAGSQSYMSFLANNINQNATWSGALQPIQSVINAASVQQNAALTGIDQLLLGQ
jgi:hypothetical protein